MKLRIAVICWILTLVSKAQPAEQLYSFSWNHTPLKQVIVDIETETQLKFAYSSSKLDVKQLISLSMADATLEQVLNQVFTPLQITWQRKGRMVTLFEPEVQRYTISGYVSEQGTGERIIGAVVSANPSRSGSVSNHYGFYSITLPADTYEISFQYLGFHTYKKQLILNRSQAMNIELEPAGFLDEVVVSESSVKIQKTLNHVTVPTHQIEQVPMLLGEKDVVRYIMLQPGVQKGNEGSNYLFVRGGAADQNLVLLDDAVIYNAHHFMGISSLFNGSELRRAELIKGGFSAKYGGRLSSVLDMSLKDGNKERLAGEANIGLIASRLMIEAPIVKNKSSFLISARRSYLNYASEVIAQTRDQVLNYHYYDVHAKVSTDIGLRDRLYLSTYVGEDVFNNASGPDANPDDGIRWANRAASLRWNHQYTNRLFSNTALVFSNYINQFGLSEKRPNDNPPYENTSIISSTILDFSVKQDWDFQQRNNQLMKFGFGITRHEFSPRAVLRLIDDINNVNQTNSASFKNWENYAYLEQHWKWGSRVTAVTGGRVSNLITDDQQFWRFEPRVSIIAEIKKNWFVNSSYALMNQFMHQITNMGFGLPIDFWMPVTGNLKPQRSHLATFGISKNELLHPSITFAVEGYYKQIENAVALREGSSFFTIIPGNVLNVLPNEWNNMVTQGTTESYGTEFMLKKEGKKLSGWLSYTLSKTTMQFDEINRGKPFPFTHDRTHDFGVFVSYFSGKHIRMSTTWSYGTGNAITMPVGTYTTVPFDLNQGTGFALPVFDYESKNNLRMAPYHRLDFSFQYLHKLLAKYDATLELSVFNAYNRANPFFYQLEQANDKVPYSEKVVKQVSLFPIVPSLSYTIRL